MGTLNFACMCIKWYSHSGKRVGSLFKLLKKFKSSSSWRHSNSSYFPGEKWEDLSNLSIKMSVCECSWMLYSLESKLETTQTSINRRMGRQTLVYSYKGIQLSRLSNNVEKPQKHYIEWKKTDTVWFHWSEVQNRQN